MNIKKMREESRMTQKGFAEYFNIPIRTLQDWEHDKRTPPEYVIELIKYKYKKEGLGMLRLLVAEEGKREMVAEGTLGEIVKYLQDNEDLYDWVNDEIDPNTGPIELPNLDDVGSLQDLEYELAKIDLSWWALEIEEI